MRAVCAKLCAADTERATRPLAGRLSAIAEVFHYSVDGTIRRLAPLLLVGSGGLLLIACRRDDLFHGRVGQHR